MISKYNVAINGAGRIGRLAVRAFFENRQKWPHLQLSHINDPHEIATLAHLLRYDSMHGRFAHSVEIQDHTLLIDGVPLLVHGSRDPSALAWHEHAVDVVLECTGRFASFAASYQHITSGAGQVVQSHPGGEGVEACVIMGVNEHLLTNAMPKVYSIGSCTTNAVAPVLAMVERLSPIVAGSLVTVHAYTNDQSLVDNHHSDLRRARAAAYSIIPTKTGACKAISTVMPHLSGKLMGYALRVPTANVSMVDCTLQLQDAVSVEKLRAHISQSLASASGEVLACTDEPLVSVDFNHHPASSVIDMSLLDVVGNTVRIAIWYDNEWGYVNRLWDVVALQYQAGHNSCIASAENMTYATT